MFRETQEWIGLHEAFLDCSLLGGSKMASITFVIDRRKRLNGRNQFTIMRIREQRLDVISHHETTDQAMDAAQRYASQARFSRLDARISKRESWRDSEQPELLVPLVVSIDVSGNRSSLFAVKGEQR
jgi:hypothetical protein